MIYLKQIPISLRISITLLLLCICIFSCSHNPEKSQATGNKILEFIEKTGKEDKSSSDKLQIYDSLYVIIKKQKNDTLKRECLIRLSIAIKKNGKLNRYFTINTEVRDLAMQIEDSLGIGNAYFNIGLYYALTDRIDSAYVYYYKSSKVYDKLGNYQSLGETYLSMAIMQKNSQDFIGAESNTIKAIHYLEKVQDVRYLASSYNNLGLISRELENYSEAIEKLKKTFELREQVNKNNILNTGTLNNIGLAYLAKKEFSTAIKYYRQGLSYDSLRHKRPEGYARLLDNLVYAKFLSGEALDYQVLFNEPLKLRNTIKDLTGVIISNIHLTKYYLKNEELDSANYYAEKALRISKMLPYNKGILESLQLLTEINEPKKALEYSKEYIRITDSLQKVERAYRDQFARIRFETDELEEVNVKVSKQRTWLLNIVVGLFVVGILSYLFFYQNRLKNKYKTINLEQRLLRSQLNPHFLFNALNSVSGLVQKKSDQTIPYISKLGELLRSILENSREEFITLGEEVETLSTYLELQSNFSKKFKFTIEVDKILDRDEILIPPMFIQPFIENAIDHGLKGDNNDNIKVHVEKKEDLLYCYIEDNGIGYSTSIKKKEHTLGHQSLSGTILKERLVLYAKSFKKKARYTIEDVVNGNGTKVILWLPYLMDE